MPKSRIMIQLEPETIEQVDKIRGAVPRAAWVRLLIEDRLRDGVSIQKTIYEWDGSQSVPVDRTVFSNPAPRRPSSRLSKYCKHINQIRKVGQPFCTDCGEFV